MRDAYLISFLLVNFAGLYVRAQDAPAAAAAGGGGGEGETKLYGVNEETFNMYKDKVCPTIPQLTGGSEAPEWRDDLTVEEVYELALLNLAYGLTTDATAHLPVSLGWKKELVDYMADITIKTCESPSLTNKYITGVKNLFLYYIHKLHQAGLASAGNDTSGGGAAAADGSKGSWDEIIEAIYTCSTKVGQIETDEDCGHLIGFTDPSGGLRDITVVTEQVDLEANANPGTGLDVIIDSVWWMFSVTYARCYRFYYPNEDIILRFYARFRDEFLTGLHARWRGGGDNMDWYSIILGPVEVDEEWDNIRKCAALTYEYEGLAGRQLVRPLMVTVSNQVMKNFKV